MTETFPIIPASPKVLYVICCLVLLLMLVILALLTASISGARNSRFELSDEGLRIRGDLYGRLIPAAQLRVADAGMTNLTTDPELRLSWRTLGTSIGGYNSGWFRLKNGDKALVYVTDRTRVVQIPTTAGYRVLLSVSDPEAFLTRLQAISPEAPNSPGQ